MAPPLVVVVLAEIRPPVMVQALEPLGLEVRAAEVTAQKDGTLAVALHLRAGEENWDLEVVV